MFMLIIWLQGIWLPQHGVDFTDTPLRAGLCMLPLTVGMLIAGPTFGILSDRYGARLFATGGMLATALTLRGAVAAADQLLLSPCSRAMLLPIGFSMGMFASPNRAAVMNSLPPRDRGAGGAMNQTFQNSAQVLSVGIFFSLMIAGLARQPARTRSAPGCTRTACQLATADTIGKTPPVSVLFAAFLGYNPVKSLVGSTCSTISRHTARRCSPAARSSRS